MTARFAFLFVCAFVLVSFDEPSSPEINTNILTDSVRYPEERHFKNLRQLTFGGDNAEAYWSFDNKSLVFQSNNPAWGLKCDQIFITPIEGVDLRKEQPKLISTGL